MRIIIGESVLEKKSKRKEMRRKRRKKRIRKRNLPKNELLNLNNELILKERRSVFIQYFESIT
jgi:hypothetical protein